MTREKLEAEAYDWLDRRFRTDDRDAVELADWAERREREAVERRDSEVGECFGVPELRGDDLLGYLAEQATLQGDLVRQRDAAEKAVAEERKAQAEQWAKLESGVAQGLERGGPNATVHVGDLLTAIRALRAALDAREKAREEPKA